MKRILLDTNILIPYLRNPEVFSERLMSYDRIPSAPGDKYLPNSGFILIVR